MSVIFKRKLTKGANGLILNIPKEITEWLEMDKWIDVGIEVIEEDNSLVIKKFVKREVK